MKLHGWGRFPIVEAPCRTIRNATDAFRLVAEWPTLIARGNGRSYGDAALSTGCILSTLASDRILSFDPGRGHITCESGVLLADLLTFLVPRGWFVPVTPGTKFVTIGGMLAADVHGKNHHTVGTLGAHVVDLTLLTAGADVVRCSPGENVELFRATLGGMGLTGLILEATLRLIPIETNAIRQETRRAADLTEALAALDGTSDWTYSVAWIDCQARGKRFGRSLIFLGEHARAEEIPRPVLVAPKRRQRRVLITPPTFALNCWSIRAFNELYYRRARLGTALVDYDSYFYPLDSIADWNRIYGRRGFVQYQCVIPRNNATEGIGQLLRRIAASGRGSFLAVLKLLGKEGDGFLSFPQEGYTLALDFPADSHSFSLLLELDAITIDHGGRIYLAKDARAGAETLRRGYARLDSFRKVRSFIDPARKFNSLLSQRLDL